jgi:hypothetical protein
MNYEMTTPDIDGLCANLRNIQSCLGFNHYWVNMTATKAAAALERQDAENERLRAALERLANKDNEFGSEVQTIARAALNQKGDER